MKTNPPPQSEQADPVAELSLLLATVRHVETLNKVARLEHVGRTARRMGLAAASMRSQGFTT